MNVTVIVPFRPGEPHRDLVWQWVRSWWETFFPTFEIITADSDHPEFNRGAARNTAARRAAGDLLVIADADTIVQAEALDAAVAAVDVGLAPWAVPYAEGRYYNLAQRATMRRLMFPPQVVAPIGEPWDSDDWEFKITSWAGCLVLPRSAYWDAGGYPEFRTWGYEDDCFRAALDVMAGPHTRIDGFALHLWHPATEEERFQNPDITSNRKVAKEYQRARTPEAMRDVIARHGVRC